MNVTPFRIGYRHSWLGATPSPTLSASYGALIATVGLAKVLLDEAQRVAMKRRVFYSFHYEPDNWRAAQVRNIGAIEGNRPATDNDWEAVKRGGDAAIRRWIKDQMNGRSCTVVLVGTDTANRKWINYEIVESWKQGMGIVGVHIHGLKDAERRTARAGDNPFEHVELPKRGLLSAAVSDSAHRHATAAVCQPSRDLNPPSAALFGSAHRQATAAVRQPNRDLNPPSAALFGSAHRQATAAVRQPSGDLDLSAALFGSTHRQATADVRQPGGLLSQFERGSLDRRPSAYTQGLSAVVRCYYPAGRNSKEQYDWITKYLSAVVEEAIHIRKRY